MVSIASVTTHLVVTNVICFFLISTFLVTNVLFATQPMDTFFIVAIFLQYLTHCP